MSFKNMNIKNCTFTYTYVKLILIDFKLGTIGVFFSLNLIEAIEVSRYYLMTFMSTPYIFSQ